MYFWGATSSHSYIQVENLVFASDRFLQYYKIPTEIYLFVKESDPVCLTSGKKNTNIWSPIFTGLEPPEDL